jgi:hypothetical protein
MFGKILKDIEGVKSSFFKLKGGLNSRKYPSMINSTNVHSITNQPDYRDGGWKESRGYAFHCVRVDSKGVIKPDEEWQEHRLQINPQDLSQDEIFAIQVTPTFRGVLVEHQGVTIKDITISGTTGLSPNRRDGGADSRDGHPVMLEGISGFEEFHELRSYFRMYVEAKRQEQKSDSQLRLVYSNFKDNEYLFVEPQKFSMKRNSSKPFLYDYNISLKAVGVASAVKGEDRLGGILGSVDELLAKANEYSALAVQIINGSFGLIARFQRDLTATVLGPLQNLNAAIDAIQGGAAMNFGEFGITRLSTQQLDNELRKIESNFNDVIGKNSKEYDKATGRTQTLTSSIGRQPTYQELQTLNGIQAGKKACAILMSKLELFEPDIFTTNAQVISLFPNANIEAPASISTTTISGGDNIQTIALRELGDVDKFKEIVILNNLKPPYISAAGGPGVLKPGQRILIPSAKVANASSVVKSQRYNITSEMQQAEIDLGVDLRINDDSDLIFTNTKDLDLVAGVDNMVQAIGIKLLLEQGGLKRHPFIGTNLQIGSKVRNGSLTQIRRQIINSFNQDARVDSIPFIELIQEGGTIQINMMVKLKDVDQPVPLPLTLNVG